MKRVHFYMKLTCCCILFKEQLYVTGIDYAKGSHIVFQNNISWSTWSDSKTLLCVLHNNK